VVFSGNNIIWYLCKHHYK